MLASSFTFEWKTTFTRLSVPIPLTRERMESTHAFAAPCFAISRSQPRREETGEKQTSKEANKPTKGKKPRGETAVPNPSCASWAPRRKRAPNHAREGKTKSKAKQSGNKRPTHTTSNAAGRQPFDQKCCRGGEGDTAAPRKKIGKKWNGTDGRGGSKSCVERPRLAFSRQGPQRSWASRQSGCCSTAQCRAGYERRLT